MGLLQAWRELAYSTEVSKQESDAFWANYFEIEKGIYEKILARKTAVKGTVADLAKKFDTEVMIMVGFLDGINDSLKKPNPIEEMTEEIEVSLAYDKEKLYYNMHEAKASWLYELKEWDGVLSAEKRHEITKQYRASKVFVKENTVRRNDPCPCGSGKKYKNCCGKNA